MLQGIQHILSAGGTSSFSPQVILMMYRASPSCPPFSVPRPPYVPCYGPLLPRSLCVGLVLPFVPPLAAAASPPPARGARCGRALVGPPPLLLGRDLRVSASHGWPCSFLRAFALPFCPPLRRFARPLCAVQVPTRLAAQQV